MLKIVTRLTTINTAAWRLNGSKHFIKITKGNGIILISSIDYSPKRKQNSTTGNNLTKHRIGQMYLVK